MLAQKAVSPTANIADLKWPMQDQQINFVAGR